MSANPKVTYIIPYFDETGQMRAPYLICKGFAKAGWQTEIATILTSRNEDIFLAWEQVPVIKAIGANRKARLLRLALGQIVRRRSHVAITEVWTWHSLVLMLAKLLFGNPYALTLDTYTHMAPWDENNILARVKRELRYGIAMRNADLILAESPLSYEHAVMHIHGPDIQLVPVCLWSKELSEIEEKWEKESFHPRREAMILYTGQITERKNLHDLIIAFNNLAEMFPEWQLEIRGPVRDAEYEAHLKDLARSFKLSGRIQFLPGLTGEELYKRYASSSVYCLPSRYEGIPTTILEAMYFGGAIVAGSAGHISYQLDNGSCGILFEPGNVVQLTQHLETLMKSNSVRLALMNRARSRLLELFIWERHFGLLEEKFRRLALGANA